MRADGNTVPGVGWGTDGVWARRLKRQERRVWEDVALQPSLPEAARAGKGGWFPGKAEKLWI